MTSTISDITYANNHSKAILDNISMKNETKLYKLEANIDDPMINTAWNAFGTYLSRNIRLGRAITIPKLGLITFSAPYVNLEGVTNPQQRDLRQRTPVLLINKEFVKGLSVREGIVVGGTVRAFSMKGVISGLPQIRANYTDIGYNAGMDKDTAKICVERVIKELADKARLGKNVDMEIPNLGRFLIRNQTAAIEFDEFLVTDALDATNKLKDFRAKGESSALTGPNLRDFMYQTFQTPGSRYLEVDKPIRVNESAQNWLKSTLNIDVNEIKPTGRPQTSKSISSHSAMSSPKRNLFKDTDSVCSSVASSNRSFRPATSKLINNSELLHEKSQFEIFQNGKKKIKKWVKGQSLISEEAFLEIVRKTIGPNASPKAKLNFLEFKRGLHRIPGLNLEIEEIDAISKALDYDNQKTIDIEKWNKFFRNEKSYVSYIQEVVAKYNLHNDDILRRMSLNKNSAAQTVHSLKEKLKALDPTIGDSEAQKTAQEILQGRERIEVVELIKIIGSQVSTQEESNWYISQLMTLKKKVGNLLKLRDQFEKIDEKSAGLVDTTVFKAVISKYLTGLSNDELKRFTRQVEKDTDMKIDYVNFVEVLEKVKTEDELQNLTQSPSLMALEQFNVINDKLQEYFNAHRVQPKDVIEQIYINQSSEQTDSKKVLLDFFAEFLHQICKSSFVKKRSCRDFANRVDIDKDGFINETDLKTFVNRNSYIKESTKEALFGNLGYTGSSNSKVFPKIALPEEKVEVILRDLRQTLNKKRISFYEFFQMIDITRTGFVTINDFCTGIDKVMKLSKPIKDGFFAYIDHENIGIINYEDFVKVLKRSIVDKPSETSEDNFDWQNQIINRIKDYTIEKKLSPEDTFRIIDCDFDGFISKNDLTQFLKEVLVVQSQEVTQPRVERLFKLMDIYKRGCIQLSDVKTILNNINTRNNFILTAGSTLVEKASFDWILHARQQIGLALSRQFSSLKASYESISEKNTRMKFGQFKNWVENNRILSGFNMTEKLLQKLFADLDPHKKGYLSEVDWLNAFNGYNVQNQVLLEVQEALTTNYSDIENAFEFFISHESQINTEATEITYQGFQKAMEALLPRRFDNNDMSYLWNKCSGDKNVITFKRFSTLFGNKNFSGTSYGPIARNALHPIISVRPKTSGASVFSVTNVTTNYKISKEEKQRKVFDKLRQILISAGISVEAFFSRLDTDRSGDLSNLEFINAIKNLNLGLNLTEIEDLLVYCDSNQDGKISFHEFVRKFAPQNTQNRLFERAKNKLKRFKDNIYAYMLSPKDAFLNFNEDRTGRLSYDQFNKLVNRLCVLSREEVPPFAIIKDMFDFIDIRRDGIIDMTEWMQSLRLIENDTIALDKTSTAVKRRSATTNVRSLTKTFGEASSASKQKPESAFLKKSLNVSTWECSPEYEKVLKIIGKHRKGLTTAFENLKQKGATIDAARVKETIGELLNGVGLKLDDDQWYYLYKFAEKDGVIDFKYMLEVFKERLYLLSAHPKKSTVDY